MRCSSSPPPSSSDFCVMVLMEEIAPALRQLEAIETHSGYDFPWSPTKLIPSYGGSEHHDYHLVGGKSQSNFASIFTYCDWIYGTDKGFRYQWSFLHKARKAKVGKEADDWIILTSKPQPKPTPRPKPKS